LRLANGLGSSQETADLHQQLADGLAGIQQQLADGMAGIQQELTALKSANVERYSTTSKVTQLLLSNLYANRLRHGSPCFRFEDIEFRAFSENGEDGILLYLFSIIGTTNKKCVEMCAGDGIECNTANLIINHGWDGLLFDGNEQWIESGKAFYSTCPLTYSKPPILVTAWISAENVNSLIKDNGYGGEIDLFSLDMDGVDYWIWKAIDCIQPRVVVLEFNADWGPNKEVTVAYKPDFRMDYRRQPTMDCGASLPAFCKLGREKGYRLVGVQRGGWNAFFIRRGIGEEIFPEISATQAFSENRILRNWDMSWMSAHLMPNASDSSCQWVEV